MKKPAEHTVEMAPIDSMKIEWWPIEKPIPYARNARKLSSSAVDKVAASVKEFGWRQPIVVDKEGVIAIGHTRLKAAQKLGLTHVPVHVAEDLTPGQIKALRLMDNRAHQESFWDNDLLGPEILDLKTLDVDLKITGFDRTEIQEVVLDGWEPAEKPEKGKASKGDGLEFRIVVDCDSEDHQTELLRRFEEEELTCRPLIS